MTCPACSITIQKALDKVPGVSKAQADTKAGTVKSVGVAYKIVTNLIMLPVVASYFRFDERFVLRASKVEALRNRMMASLGLHIANPRNAAGGRPRRIPRSSPHWSARR